VAGDGHPYELAETIARRLGFTGALGTVAESVDGVFTGRLVGDILHGAGKAHAVRALAIREGLNLKRCTALGQLQRRADAVAGRHGGRHQPGRRPARPGPRAGREIRDFRPARKAARIGVPSALALGAVGGALAAAVSWRHEHH
jgi:hypothetical protein